MWQLLNSLGPAEREEALSPLNRYFAWQALGHEPSDEECLVHYVLHRFNTVYFRHFIVEDDPHCALFI